MNNISVVICVRNGMSTLERCLISVVKNDPSELIIIDGNSSDKTIEIAKLYTNNIYSDEGRGLATARQMGANLSVSEYIAYIDCDTELPNPSILSELLKEMQNNKWIAIHAQVKDPRRNKSYWEKGENFHFENHQNIPGEKKIIGTIVCIVRRDIILKYKFDPKFEGAAEDGDFFYRIGKDGLKFGTGSQIAYHYHRSNFKQFIRQRIWYGKGNFKMANKNKNLMSIIGPLGIFTYGFILCFTKKKIIFLPFYFVWSLFLSCGIFIGLIKAITGWS